MVGGKRTRFGARGHDLAEGAVADRRGRAGDEIAIAGLSGLFRAFGAGAGAQRGARGRAFGRGPGDPVLRVVDRLGGIGLAVPVAQNRAFYDDVGDDGIADIGVGAVEPVEGEERLRGAGREDRAPGRRAAGYHRLEIFAAGAAPCGEGHGICRRRAQRGTDIAGQFHVTLHNPRVATRAAARRLMIGFGRSDQKELRSIS